MSITNRLHQHTANMVAFEGELYLALKQLSELAGDHPDAVLMLDDFCAISESHLKTLKARLKTISDEFEVPDSVLPALKLVSDNYPVSSALQQASSILNSAIIGYAMLRSIALRYRDSILIGDDNTGDIAEQHTKNYVGAAHRINQFIHNVVLWEMNNDSEICQCTCPSCGLGICMCAQSPRLTLSNIWAEQGPISIEREVLIHSPRPGSAANNAGLHHGDTVVAADDQELESHFTLQGVVKTHKSGEKIVLQIRRSSGELEEVLVTIP
jgi:hypothetical protein